MAESKLTKAMRDHLRVIPDWSAPYEVRGRLGRELTESGRECDVISKMLTRLVAAGLAEYGRANNTYRITEAGRAALQLQGGSEQ